MSTITPNGRAALNASIKKATESKKVSGFVLGISNINEEIYFNGGGQQTINDEESMEVNPDSVFWICSQTKMIVSLALLKLIELGKVSVDTEVADYIPQLANPVIVEDETCKRFKVAKTAITVMHLLNFTTGLFYPLSTDGSLPTVYTNKKMHVVDDPVSMFFDLIKGDLPGVPIKFEPGTDFAYGWTADVMGFFIEKVTGQTLEHVLKEYVFRPLDMETSFYLTSELRKRLVHLSHRNVDGSLTQHCNQLEVMEQDPRNLGLHLGGVGLYSSMRDYLKLLRHIMQIHGGISVPNAILSRETVRQIFTPALPERGENSLSKIIMVPGTQWGTAMALVTQSWPDRRKAGSAFWGGWAYTHHLIDPTNGIAVVYGTQISPYGDVEHTKLWLELEALVYSALSEKN